ncbi:MAG: 50S ribosomal protein L24 [Armatimonadetes bacterium]|nr:50S ribosomal protein L24 [Armatimonadota bacterium]
MNKTHVRKGDTVIVLNGKDKGKKGKILGVYPDKGKVLVEGINVFKRHTKPRPPKIPQGGILDKVLPIFSDKVMLVCSKCGIPTRIKKRIENKEKSRICRKCGEIT